MGLTERHWFEKNIGIEYVAEALEKYDKINSGMAETVEFVKMVEEVKAEVEGRRTECKKLVLLFY